jgi:hypothetical protein
VDGSYLGDLFGGLMVVSFGLGAVFVGVTTAANSGVPADRAGLAAALLNACQQVGSALGLAIFSAVATARTSHLLTGGTAVPDALTSGFRRALLTGSVFLLGAALLALRTHNTHSEGEPMTTQDAGTEVDFTMMYAAHNAFTRDLRRLNAAGVPGWGPADRARWQTFVAQLHIHHRAEDAALWPPLRALDLTADEAATLDAMELEHAQIDPHLDQIEAAIAAADRPALALNLQRLAEGLAAHMRHEENAALPMIQTHLGAAGWGAFTATFRETQGIRGAATYFPWLLEEAPADVRTKVVGLLPPPARLLYRTVWAPRYQRGQR